MAASKDVIGVKLRFPKGLLRQLEREAKKNNRSANAEAVERLTRSFTSDSTGVGKSTLDVPPGSFVLDEMHTLIRDAASQAGKEAAEGALSMVFKFVDDLVKRTEGETPAHDVQAEESTPQYDVVKARIERLAKKASGLLDEHAKRIPRDQAETEPQVEKGNDRE
jgi:hypothetical protein